jgi:hypothetical protein
MRCRNLLSVIITYTDLTVMFAGFSDKKLTIKKISG